MDNQMANTFSFKNASYSNPNKIIGSNTLSNVNSIFAYSEISKKNDIIPGHQSQDSKLFRWSPDTVENANHDLHWWKKNNLELLRKFISSTQDKSKQGLGALYVLMGFATIVREVGEAYPWVLDTV
jgi:hypothetical protein